MYGDIESVRKGAVKLYAGVGEVRWCAFKLR